MGLLKLEDKVEKWIENHRTKWIFLLLGLCVALGFFENYLLGGSSEQGAIIIVSYSFIILTCEFIFGGTKKEEYGNHNRTIISN